MTFHTRGSWVNVKSEPLIRDAEPAAHPCRVTAGGELYENRTI